MVFAPTCRMAEIRTVDMVRNHGAKVDRVCYPHSYENRLREGIDAHPEP